MFSKALPRRAPTALHPCGRAARRQARALRARAHRPRRPDGLHRPRARRPARATSLALAPARGGRRAHPPPDERDGRRELPQRVRSGTRRPTRASSATPHTRRVARPQNLSRPCHTALLSSLSHLPLHIPPSAVAAQRATRCRRSNCGPGLVLSLGSRLVELGRGEASAVAHSSGASSRRWYPRCTAASAVPRRPRRVRGGRSRLDASLRPNRPTLSRRGAA